jgi:hypothetical protein
MTSLNSNSRQGEVLFICSHSWAACRAAHLVNQISLLETCSRDMAGCGFLQLPHQYMPLHACTTSWCSHDRQMGTEPCLKLTGPLSEAMCTVASDPSGNSDFDANFGRLHLLRLLYPAFLVAQTHKAHLAAWYLAHYIHVVYAPYWGVPHKSQNIWVGVHC